MSVLKTRVSISEVEDFLKKHFSTDIKNIEILKGGEISQAFSFEDVAGNYVIKVRKVRKRFRKKNPFDKEIIISDVVKKYKLDILVPEIIKHGSFKEIGSEKFIYCISEKSPGTFVHLFNNEKTTLVDNNLVESLYKIHLCDITNTKGFGNWDKWGKARFRSMQEYILDVIKQQEIYTNERFSTGIFEKDLYIQGSERIKQLVKFCSPKRYLVHADYGYDNVLANKEGKITAIYDWEHSIYGDFVYDIAWIDFWGFREENTYSNLYCKKFRDSERLDFDNYDQRLLCYKLYIGMTAAGFFSESNQEDKYLQAKQRVLSLLIF